MVCVRKCCGLMLTLQVVRETSSRDRYRKLKRDITAKLTYERLTVPSSGIAKTASYRAALTKAALLPLTAVALPTIRESSTSAKRQQSDPQTPRLTKSLVHAPSRTGRSVRPVTSLRPSHAALPMRSWNSDDSNILVSCGSGNDVTFKSGAAKRARLSRNARIDETSGSVVAPSIVISSPDDCDRDFIGDIKSPPPELSSAPRRSSCPFPVYDVTPAAAADGDDKSTSSSQLNSPSAAAAAAASAAASASRKRRRDFALSETLGQRSPSVQSVTTCDAELERRPTAAAAAAAGASSDGEVRWARANKCQSSSLDVVWPLRRLSLPQASTFAAASDDLSCRPESHVR